MVHYNIGDIIFQLFALLVPLILIVLFVRFIYKRNKQLKRIEDKLDMISEQKTNRELLVFISNGFSSGGQKLKKHQ